MPEGTSGSDYQIIQVDHYFYAVDGSSIFAFNTDTNTWSSINQIQIGPIISAIRFLAKQNGSWYFILETSQITIYIKMDRDEFELP